MSVSASRLWFRYANLGPIVGVVFGGALLAIGFVVRMTHDGVEARFARSGVKADAKVIEKSAKKLPVQRPRARNPQVSDGPRSLFLVAYEFTDAAGIVHRGSSDVTAEAFASLNRGDKIGIEYRRDEPRTSRIVPARARLTDPTWLGSAILGMGAAIGTLSVVWLGHEAIKAARRARIVRYGSPFPGWVDEIDEHPRPQGEPHYLLSYHFRDADGDDGEGWACPSPRPLASG